MLSLVFTVRATILQNAGLVARPPLYSQIIKCFMSMLMLTSLALRIPVKWPRLVTSVIKIQSAVAVTQEARPRPGPLRQSSE